VRLRLLVHPLDGGLGHDFAVARQRHFRFVCFDVVRPSLDEFPSEGCVVRNCHACLDGFGILPCVVVCREGHRKSQRGESCKNVTDPMTGHLDFLLEFYFAPCSWLDELPAASKAKWPLKRCKKLSHAATSFVIRMRTWRFRMRTLCAQPSR